MIAAIYARKSTDQNGVAEAEKSVTRQITHATAYAATKGWTVADEHVYVDDGISGAEFTNRPGFLRLMNALKPAPPFQVLIMSEESRLGREAIETAFALKQLVTAGVRVFFYLEDRERTLDSPTEKIMLSLTAFADELEREKARQRTADAMARKARAGHVTGGRVFGYDNVEVYGEPDEQGRRTRQHVERRINEAEAVVVREIFERCAAGWGFRRIAKHLNAQQSPCPRAQQGRPRSWAPSSVRSMVYRPLYRGEVIWNRSRKRDQWGRSRQTARPETEWVRRFVPELRIVSDDLWDAVHKRLDSTRKTYLRGTGGRLWGRPTSGVESKYLLTGLAQCAGCGGSLVARSRSHGRRRAYMYGCTSYHHRGTTVCTNRLEMRMVDADDAVLAQLERDVLRPEVVEAVLDRALERLTPSADVLEAQRRALRTRLEQTERELGRLGEGLATGGHLATVLSAIKDRERRFDQIQQELAGLEGLRRVGQVDRSQLERDLHDRIDDWRGLLHRHVPQARQILRKLLLGRLVFTPRDDHYEFTGKWRLDRLLAGVVHLPQSMASPTGFEPVF